MYFISINGVEMPVPVSYSVSSKDIDSPDSRRSDETGISHRNRIRSSVKTCDIKWRIDGNAAKSLSVKLSDELLSVSMLDPASCGYINCDMYTESVKSSFYQHQKQNEGSSYWEISCRLVEF